MLLSLITNEQYTSLRLPDRPEGRFFICDPQNGKQLFAIFSESGKWRFSAMEGNQFLDTPPEYLWNGMMISVRIRDLMEKAFLFAQEASPRYAKYARCPVPDYIAFTYGTDESNQLKSINQYISVRQFSLVCRNRHWSVSDLNSTYGTFVNGHKIDQNPVSLLPGDIVSSLNQRFIVLPGLLVFNAQDLDSKRLHGILHAIKVPDLSNIPPFGIEEKRVWFSRSPRFTNASSDQTLSVQAPPLSKQQKDDKTATMLSMGPSLSSGLIMLLGGMNPIYGIGMAVSSLLWPQLGKKHTEKLQKAEEEKRQKQYNEYLLKIDAELEDIRSRQTKDLSQKSIEPGKEASTLLDNSTALWNRRPDQSDFMDIRLGIGDIPMQASISFPQQNETEVIDDPTLDRLKEIENKPRDLKNVPILLQLGNSQSIGICGPEKDRISMMEKVLLQLIMHIGYDDMKLCILGRLPENDTCLRWLPHTWDDQSLIHYNAEDDDELMKLLPELDSLITACQPGISDQKAPSRHLVILITDIHLAHTGMLQRMLFEKELKNVHIITLSEHGKELPGKTDAAIRVSSQKGRMIWQQDEKRNTVDFVPDPSVTHLLSPFAFKLSNTFLDLKKESFRIPDIVPFLDLFGVQDVNYLNLLSRWQQSDPIHSLKAPIGISEDGTLCYLDLHESADGSHGLIAGTTGSGKSELVMSYILSSAVCYSPEELAFVLIDFKGGGMAQVFEHLPHTVGIITNLDGNEINRALMSIESELSRRQKLLSDTEHSLKIRCASIQKYQQLYRERKVTDPLPHLIIITDEFAELKTQEPEFMEQLIRTSRIGRSLGIHMILATQKPAGIVDDQIWSNTNAKLCLRVQEPMDSQDVLKKPDAAYITHVGRFYKQIGYSETMIQAQSAWTGAPYTPNDKTLPSCYADVLDHAGRIISRGELPSGQKDEATQLDAVTDYIISVAKQEHLAARKLWLPVLESEIPLSSLYSRYQVDQDPWILNPVIGELDNPANQCREIVRANLSEGKNAIVYGSIGSGKLQFVTTALADLMTHHTPEQLQIYILDYADDGMHLLSSAPHIGDVLYSDDTEKLDRFMVMMEDIIKERKRQLGGGIASGSIDQRLKNSGTCYLLVVLHHLLTIQNQLGDRTGDLVRLLSEGPRYGICFLATAETDTGLRFALQQRFASIFVLQQDQDDAYSALIGRTNGMKPSPIKGRGLIRNDDILYEFQTAVPDEDLTVLCDNLKKDWNGITAAPIRVMPDQVTSDLLIPFLKQDKPLTLPVGLSLETIEPVFYPFGKNQVTTVLGIGKDLIPFLSGFLPLFGHNGISVTAFDPEGDLVGIDYVDSLSLSETQDKINEMFEECKKIRADLQAGIVPDDRTPHVFVLPSLKSITDRIRPESKDLLESMLLKARPEWNWYFILCDMPQNMSGFRISEWFDSTVSKTDALFVGGNISSYPCITVNDSGSFLYHGCSYPEGYIVLDGMVQQCKLVSGRMY